MEQENNSSSISKENKDIIKNLYQSIDDYDDILYDISALDFKNNPFESNKKNSQPPPIDNLNLYPNQEINQLKHSNKSKHTINRTNVAPNHHVNFQPQHQAFPINNLNYGSIPMVNYTNLPIYPTYYPHPIVIQTPISSVPTPNNSSGLVTPNIPTQNLIKSNTNQLYPRHQNPNLLNVIQSIPNKSNSSQQMNVKERLSCDHPKHASRSSKVTTKANSVLDELFHLDIDFLTSQKGSKQLQKFLETATEDLIIALFFKIEDIIPQIVNNKFGNYFLQKFIFKLNRSLRFNLWEILIKESVLSFANNEFGNHSIQALVQVSAGFKDEEDFIMNTLNPYFHCLAFGKYGYFILLKIISDFSEKNRSVIINFIEENLNSLMFHIHGVCLIKKYIINIADKEVLQHALLRNLKSKLTALFNDKIGSFVILCIFDEWYPISYKEISTFIKRNFLLITESKIGICLIERYLEVVNKVSNYTYTFYIG